MSCRCQTFKVSKWLPRLKFILRAQQKAIIKIHFSFYFPRFFTVFQFFFFFFVRVVLALALLLTAKLIVCPHCALSSIHFLLAITGAYSLFTATTNRERDSEKERDR